MHFTLWCVILPFQCASHNAADSLEDEYPPEKPAHSTGNVNLTFAHPVCSFPAHKRMKGDMSGGVYGEQCWHFSECVKFIGLPGIHHSWTRPGLWAMPKLQPFTPPGCATQNPLHCLDQHKLFPPWQQVSLQGNVMETLWAKLHKKKFMGGKQDWISILLVCNTRLAKARFQGNRIRGF